MSEKPQFEYLLNAMENASQQDRPADHAYGAKRRAVLGYVATLLQQRDELRAAAQVLLDQRAEICQQRDALREALREIASFITMDSQDAGKVIGSSAKEIAEKALAEQAECKECGFAENASAHHPLSPKTEFKSGSAYHPFVSPGRK